MNRFGILAAAAGVVGLLVSGSASSAWAAPPRIGYVYPAGGQAGDTFEARIGGQYLGEPFDVLVSGKGVSVEIIDHNRLPSAQVISDYRDRIREIQGELRALGGRGVRKDRDEVIPKIHELLASVELDEKMVRQVDQYTRQRNDPKRQLNSQIGETVTVSFKISGDAEPGIRYCRLLTANGLSNPMRFVVGKLPEYREPEVWDFDLPTYLGIETIEEEKEPVPGADEPVPMPATLNGQILPGEVDEFIFTAAEGDQVVVSLQARNLVPYLADAVPGWFQAVVSLQDTRGNELAYADDYRFDPDPVLFYKIPRDGEYRVRVHDSIYRGREDFVYRITVGELPFLTGISPLGGQAGTEIDLNFQGGNLVERERKRFALPEVPGIIELAAAGSEGMSNPISFHVDEAPDVTEREDNNRMGVSFDIELPSILNGKIGWPGDVDFFRVKGSSAKPMTFEIFARRLGSPLDANLTIFDNDGKQIAWNDDFENPSAGLTTHHADARVTVTVPKNGLCFVRVADTQNRGSFAHSYRLKITQGPPAFYLRGTPSSLNAKPGASAQLTVHAVRLDGFEGAIKLELKDAPAGFELKNGIIPAGENSAKVSIGVPNSETEVPVPIELHGTAEFEDRDPVMHPVVPSEDMMQAFIYHHLVPVDEMLIDVRRPPEGP